jgi:DNA-binding transcriptional LysR family regulator
MRRGAASLDKFAQSMCKNAPMDWDGLQVFLAIARAGRISAAARRLMVEHTTIARRLAALEAELGVALFYRTTTGYLLTPHGQNVLPNAEAMERAAFSVASRARENSDAVAGRVRLAMSPEFASHWVAPHLVAFRDKHPQIELQILVGTRQRDLSRGEAELSVQSPRPRQQGLVAMRIARAATALYASRALLGARRLRVDSVESMRGLMLLVYTAPFHILQEAKWFQPILDAATIGLETNSTHVLLAAARAGVGIAVLPQFVGCKHDDLVAVSDTVAEHDVWLITHPEFRRDPKVRAAGEFLKRVAVDLTANADT